MVGAPINAYAIAARLTKAFKLASHLHRHGITAEEAKLLEPIEWQALARAVCVNKPSDETIAETLRMLGDFERELVSA